jgi:hypothetical protein
MVRLIFRRSRFRCCDYIFNGYWRLFRVQFRQKLSNLTGVDVDRIEQEGM